MADRYWVNDDADGDFSGANNWSASTGGAGGASVPGTGDVAIFDGNGTDNCTLSAHVTLGGLTHGAAYTGTLDFADKNVTGDDGADFICDGTGLDLGTGTLGITNGTFDFKDVTTATGTATVEFNGTCTLTSKATYIFYSYDIQSGTTTLGSDALPRGNTFVRNGAVLAIQGFIFTARGDIETEAGSTVTSTTGRLATVSGTATLAGDFSGLALIWFWGLFGHIDLLACDLSATTVRFSGKPAYHIRLGAGAFTFEDLEIWNWSSYGVTVDCSTSAVTAVTILGDLTNNIDNALDATINNSGQSPVWDIQGDVIDEVSGSGSLVWTAGNANPEIKFTGTNDQDIDFDGVSIGKLEIDKSAGTVTLSGAFNPNTLDCTDGDLDPNGQTITTTGAFNADSGFTFNTGDADSLNGCSWIVGGNLTLDGQTLNATASWTLTVTGTAVASGTGDVAYSDASGGTQINASAGPWTDSGNNSNWNFGAGITRRMIGSGRLAGNRGGLVG